MEPLVPPQIIPEPVHFTEQAAYEKGFADLFEEKIKPLVRELEMIRVQKTERIKTNRPRANMILLGAIVVGIALTYATKHLGPLIFLGLVAALIRQGMISIPATEFASQFKKKIVPEIIKFFGDFEYKNTAGISIDIIKQSDLFDNFNQSYFGDTVTGRYHGKSMEFAETTLSNKSGKSSTTIFAGKIIILELGRTLMGKIIVKRESQKGLWSRLTGKSHGLKKVEVQDPRFEDIFEVYSSDPNEAQTIVTPDIVRKLLQLNDLYEASAVRCSFFENKILLALSFNPELKDHDIFEIGTMDNAINDNIHKFLAQFHAILEILDTLNPVSKF